jgi:hypothetical protein
MLSNILARSPTGTDAAPMTALDTPARMTKGHLLRLFGTYHAAWSARTQFRQAIADIGRLIEAGKTSQAAVVLAEDAGWRTALLGLSARAEVPVHDHPHTRGLLFVEAGTVALERFDVVDRTPRGRSVALACRGSVTLGAGDHDWFGKSYRNLHGLRAGNDGALIFSIRQVAGPPENPSLYARIETGDTLKPVTQVAIVIPSDKGNGRGAFD